MNISLLCKWWWKLDKEAGLWQDIVRYKYIKNASLHNIKHKQTDSPIWSDLLKIKNIYLQGRKMSIRNGEKTLFWKDIWLYNKPMADTHPILFKLAQQKDISVSEVINNPQQVTFSRYLLDDWRKDWMNILVDIHNIQLSDGEDTVSWKLGTKGKFSVKSVYNALTENDVGPYHKKIWTGKIPAKIKIFLWLILNKALLTKDNLIRRNG